MATPPPAALSSSPGDVPFVFEMEPRLPESRVVPLHSSQDLLAVFGLHAAYDKYVRPKITPIEEQDAATSTTAPAPATTPASAVPPALRKVGTPLLTPGTPMLDKGKARRVDSPLPTTPATARPTLTLSAAPIKLEHPLDATVDDRGKRKKDHSYKHLVRHLPGKHSMKKDSYFSDLIRKPPQQHTSIIPFDNNILTKAFSIKDVGVLGYDKTVIIGLDSRQKDEKKRRKEEKRAHRERQRLINSGQLDPNTPIAGPSTPNPALGTLVASGGFINRPSSTVATPRPAAGPVGTPISRRPSLAPQASAGPPSGARSRSLTPKPASAGPNGPASGSLAGPRQPTVKAETPGPSTSLSMPMRNASSTGQQQQQQQQQQQRPSQASSQQGPSGARPPTVNRPGSVSGQQRAAQQRPASKAPTPSASGPSRPGSKPATPQRQQQQQQQQQQSRAAPGQQGAPRPRPPGIGTPGMGARPLPQHQNGMPPRGTIRKERELDDLAGSSSSRPSPMAAGGSVGGGPRPAKKPRMDSGPPGSGPGQVRRPQVQAAAASQRS
ncbi:hypothetical protein BKA62DRAFT_687118 [Auriculariales sp. MPI-PUGE-AT-0066]|nr:hypothetical protein BKA62DRAFT_687118 [Auriculariales sp. MPI-PUGE-AT-0066]